MSLTDNEIRELVQHLTDAHTGLQSAYETLDMTPDVYAAARAELVVRYRLLLRAGPYPLEFKPTTK